MRKLLQSGLLTICALAISGCATSGKVAECPNPTEPPASLMQAPTTEQRVRQELFKPQGTPTPKSVDSRR